MNVAGSKSVKLNDSTVAPTRYDEADSTSDSVTVSVTATALITVGFPAKDVAENDVIPNILELGL